MVPSNSLEDRIRTYAAFGGVPKYLRAVVDARPLEENITQLLLDPHGGARLQLETLLRQEEGLREYTKYQGFLEAVGIKRRNLGQIAAALGQGVDTGLRRMVAQLVELGLLDVEPNFGEPRNQALRYRIADPAVRFHQAARGLPPVEEWGRWEGPDRDRHPTEVDVVRSWAHDALHTDSPMCFAAAAGFKTSFHEVAKDLGQAVITWTAEDLFQMRAP